MTTTPSVLPTPLRSPDAAPQSREAPVARPATLVELTADEQAERAVTLASGGGMLVLTVPGVPQVNLGPYPNPDVLKERLKAVRRFVVALIQSLRPPIPSSERPKKKRRSTRRDGGFPADSDLHQMTDDGCPLSPDPTRWSDADWGDVPPPGKPGGG